MASSRGTSPSPDSNVMIELATKKAFPLNQAPSSSPTSTGSVRLNASQVQENPLFAKQPPAEKRLTSFPQPGMVSDVEELLVDRTRSSSAARASSVAIPPSTLALTVPKSLSPPKRGSTTSPRPRRNWMPDKVCKVCSDCGESFNIFRRRHHCRACGHIFCHSCSPYAVESIEQGVKTHVRICKQCHQSRSATLSATNTTEVAMDFPPGLLSPLVSQTVFDYGNVAGFDLEFDPSDVVLSSGVDSAAADPARSSSLYAHLFRRPSYEVEAALKAIHDAEEHLEKSSSSMLEMVDEEMGGRGSSCHDDIWSRHHSDCHSPPLSSTKSRLGTRPSFGDGMDGHQSPFYDDADHPSQVPADPTPATPLEAHQMAGRRQLRKMLERGMASAVGDLLPDSAHLRAAQDELERVIDETTELLIRATYNRNAVDGMFNHQDMLHVKTIAEVPDYDAPTAGTYSGQVIHGIVCRKNVSHKKAPRMLERPRVLLLGGSIVTDRESSKLTKFEDLLNDEAAYAQHLVDKILAVNPSVVFVEQSVSRLAQDQLQQHNIALVLKVKEATLRRLERLTRATMVPSIDAMQPEDTSVLGTACGSFAVVPTRVVDPTKEPGGWKRDSILIVDGCDASAGCTILLKGPNKAVLRALKALVLQLVPQAYDLMLRAQALADLAYPVSPIEDTRDDRWTIQVIKYMLKHRDEVHKPKFSQCSRPQPHQVAFYSKNDKALGSYLQKEGIDSSTKCQVPNCKVPLIEHLEAYSFLNGTVLISTEHLPDLARTEIERTEGQQAVESQVPLPSPSCIDEDATGPAIFFWRHCRECAKMVTPPRLLPVTTLKFSFARFLETIFNVSGPQSTTVHHPLDLGTVCEAAADGRGDAPSPPLDDDAPQPSIPENDVVACDCFCPHDGQTQHLLYFKCGKRAIRVEYMQDEPWYIKHDNCSHFDHHWYLDHQRQQAADLKLAMTDHFAALFKKLRTLPQLSREVMCLELLMKTAQKAYVAELDRLVERGEVVHPHSSTVVDANTVRRAFYHSCCEWSTMVHKITSAVSANSTPLDTSPTSNDAASSSHGDGEATTPITRVHSAVEPEPMMLETLTEGAAVEPDLPPLPPISVKEPSTGDATPPVPTPVSSPGPVSWTTALSNSLGAILLGDKKPMEALALDPHHDVPHAFAGGHPFLPVGANDRVVYVYDHLRFSYVTYALNLIEYVNETTALRAALALPKDHNHEHLLLSPVDTTVKLKVSSSDVDFSCQVHYALQFEALRSMFYGDLVDFVKSLATSQHWSAKGGKSGATFFRTADDRFVIKYISQVELQSFLASAVSYFGYIGKVRSEGASSVLCKLVGVYTVTTKRWTEHLVVMENVFSRAPQLDQVFDLKGSTRNRYLVSQDPHHDVLLDGNFLERHLGLPCPLHCRSYAKLVDAIRNDAQFLSDNNIMDYSLVIGYAPGVAADGDSNRVLLVGIIDYLRHFDFLKRMESVGKSVTMIAGQAAPTVVQPKQYAKRFVDAIEQTYFMPVPSFTEDVNTL